MEFLAVLLKIVIMIFVPVITAVATYFLKKYANILIDKYTVGKVAEDLKKGVDLIANSVSYVQQTYVDDLKKQDKFTKEAHVDALELAKLKAINLMNDDIAKAIESSYGDLDEYVAIMIESLVEQKKNK